jgi:hypothetical protein
MLLFLDFDGVLHPTVLGATKFCRLQLLERWLLRRPEVDVVISSSWREETPYRDLVELFIEELQHRIIGCTPVLREMHPYSPRVHALSWPAVLGEREIEIRNWLRRSWKPERPWVALDDQPKLFRPTCSRLVACDERTGLVATDLRRLDAVLNRTRASRA